MITFIYAEKLFLLFMINKLMCSSFWATTLGVLPSQVEPDFHELELHSKIGKRYVVNSQVEPDTP